MKYTVSLKMYKILETNCAVCDFSVQFLGCNHCIACTFSLYVDLYASMYPTADIHANDMHDMV